MKPPAGPHHPPAWEPKHAAAFQALERGEASDHQQKLALEWLMIRACGINDLSYWPDSERATSFAEGKRFVGLQVVKMLSLNTAVFRNEE